MSESSAQSQRRRSMMSEAQEVPTDPRLEPIEPDADPPLPPPTAEALKVQREVEVPGIIEDLESVNQDLWFRVEDFVAASLAEKAKGKSDNAELDALKLGHLKLRYLWQTYDREADKIRSSGKFSPEGERLELAELERIREEGIQAERERLRGLAESLVDRARVPGPPPLTTDVAARGTLMAAMLPHYLPEDLVTTTLAEVSILVDPDSEEGDKSRARATLHHVLRPILRKRAVAPEHYAVPFQNVARDTLELVERLLDTSQERRAAEAWRDEFWDQWNFMDDAARKQGWPDDTIARVRGTFFKWDD
jgi:hypothetical protein